MCRERGPWGQARASLAGGCGKIAYLSCRTSDPTGCCTLIAVRGAGERIPITGDYRPRTRGVRITLQRKVSGQWRGIATTRTRIGGGFGLRPRAGAAGTWTLRVVSTSGKGNIGDRTGRFVVEVLPKPKPKPPPGCLSDCGGTTPPPTTVPVSYPTAPGEVVVLPDSRRTVPWIEAPHQSYGSAPSVPIPRTASIPASPV